MMWWDVTAGWAYHTLHADERGSIVALGDSGGNASSINRYDEYGIPQSGNLGRFQFTGQMWLREIGVYNYKNRMYWTTLGRFLQTDPIGYDDGPNWYTYVRRDTEKGAWPLDVRKLLWCWRIRCAGGSARSGMQGPRRVLCR